MFEFIKMKLKYGLHSGPSAAEIQNLKVEAHAFYKQSIATINAADNEFKKSVGINIAAFFSDFHAKFNSLPDFAASNSDLKIKYITSLSDSQDAALRQAELARFYAIYIFKSFLMAMTEGDKKVSHEILDDMDRLQKIASST